MGVANGGKSGLRGIAAGLDPSSSAKLTAGQFGPQIEQMALLLR
jgi:hypothetical protein